MIDWVKVAIVLGAVTGVIWLICLALVVGANLASRNLALASGALGGSLLLMVTQLYFELRSPSTSKEFITAEYTIYRGDPPRIRASKYRVDGSGWRSTFEQEAGRLIGEKNPA